jgi:alpha/beta superfamily hydrolase
MITAATRCSPPPANSRSAGAPRVRHVDLRGPAGRLEAVVNEGSPRAAFAGVIAHPHPLGGGSLHNKVVYHAMKVMNAPEFGFRFPVVRFNFRGTGRSEGKHDGAAEREDVLAILAWIENEYNLPLIAVGFSFGAAMTLAACCGNLGLLRARLRGIAAIGLPTRSGARAYAQAYDYSFLAHCRVPKLFLSGEHDQYATKSELIQATAAAAEPKHVALVPGADHFFTGHLEGMQLALGGWLKELVSS